MGEFDKIVARDELAGLGDEILRQHQAAQRISYAGLAGNCGFEPPNSVGPTLGTAVPETALAPDDTEQPAS